MIEPLRREYEPIYTPPQEPAPAGRARQRKSFNLTRSKLPTLIVVLLLSYLAVSFSSQFSRLSNMQRDVNSIQQQVQELKQKNASLREELQLVQSEAYIEKTAREKIGLIMPGETRVVPISEGTQLEPIQSPDPDVVINH